MSAAAGAPEPLARAPLLGRVGLALLLVGSLVIWFEDHWFTRLQSAWFDLHQTLWPRPVEPLLPVIVVAIDDKSLDALGQWPWPRKLLARLVHTIGSAEPAAIGLNILMPEADALSPERLLDHALVEDKGLTAALRALPTHDAQLAQALAGAPVVLAVAGTGEARHAPLRAAPVTVHAHGTAPGTAPAAPELRHYSGAVSSIDELDRHARGWGLTSADTSRGLIRRMPLVASVDGTLVPALAVEMLRVAQRAPSLRLVVSGPAVDQVLVGRLKLPTEADGAVRVYFSPKVPQRTLSAVDVIEGRVDATALRGRLVLVGLTGVGLHVDQPTPTGERMSGTEIHAQLLENLLDGSALQRPHWASAFEAGVFAALGAMLLWAAPRWRTHRAALLLAGCVVALVLLSALAFRTQRLLFDPVTPSLALVLFFGALLGLTLTEATRQARRLRHVVQTQRETSARIAGELRAAQQVQTASLPRADLLHGDPRVELAATLEPAREVGGDLYDYFMLDDRRLFLLLGDVAGKGLSASMFMAVSKALTKSAMLRSPHAAIGNIVAEANTEVARDNPGELFVTAFAAILDLESGEMHYCNAGHDNPYRLHPAEPEPRRILGGDGPPLCAFADYDYRGASCRLRPGEMLVLFTDGVTEAQTAAGALYGAARMQQVLREATQRGDDPAALVRTLHDDVAAFAAGAEPADDLTILALRWHGPRAGPA